ncbi:hypothetical protein [Brevibacillus reuszeri]|uniref:hypothetical protein n=1 Tax=Brevibacillus reuszeri TaxID=54915 RepID=UPI000CCC3857|nr:hypothetical protein [Brevibacillus reuszeri]
MMQHIMVRAIESFTVYNHDGTILEGEVDEGQEFVANLHEETEEYFTKDKYGREIYVGELDRSGALQLDEAFEIVQTIKFSELRPGTYIGHGEDVITQEEALKRHEQGDEIPMLTITEEFISSVLQQAYKDDVNGIERESYYAPNKGQLIVFDA